MIFIKIIIIIIAVGGLLLGRSALFNVLPKALQSLTAIGNLITLSAIVLFVVKLFKGKRK